MGTITSASVGELLKRLYASWEIEQLVNLTYPVLNECARKGSAQLGGSGFYFPVRTRSAEGHAYISEGDDLPTGLESTVLQASITPTVHAGVVQLTGLSMSVSSGNAMAFARAFDENVQQTIEAMSAYKEGAFFRDGSGQLCTFTEEPDGAETTLTMSDVNHLRPGMVVDAVDTDLSTHHDTSLTITGVDWVNKTATFDSAVAVAAAAGDFLYLDGSQASGTAATSKEPLGLEASLLATGTYLGIDRASSTNWQAGVQTVDAFLDEAALLTARTRITQATGLPLQAQSGRFKVVTHPLQTDVLFKLAIPRIRYSGNDRFDLGNSDNVYFGNTPFLTSYLAPPGTAYMGDWQYSQSLYTPNGELHIDTEYNGSALKWVATKDVGLVFVKEYHNFVVKRPNAFVKLASLTQPSR
jgi:hypothetical protein